MNVKRRAAVRLTLVSIAVPYAKGHTGPQSLFVAVGRPGTPPWVGSARSHSGAPIGLSPAAQLAWAYDRSL